MVASGQRALKLGRRLASPTRTQLDTSVSCVKVSDQALEFSMSMAASEKKLTFCACFWAMLCTEMRGIHTLTTTSRWSISANAICTIRKHAMRCCYFQHGVLSGSLQLLDRGFPARKTIKNVLCCTNTACIGHAISVDLYSLCLVVSLS